MKDDARSPARLAALCGLALLVGACDRGPGFKTVAPPDGGASAGGGAGGASGGGGAGGAPADGGAGRFIDGGVGDVAEAPEPDAPEQPQGPLVQTPCRALAPSWGRVSAAATAPRFLVMTYGGAIVLNPRDMSYSRMFQGHQGPIVDGALSPDGSLAATIGDDKSLRVWDTTTGRQLSKVKREARLSRVAFSSDGKTVAVVDMTPSVFLVEATTGHVVWDRAPATSTLGEPHFSPDGQLLFVRSDLGLLSFTAGEGTQGITPVAMTGEGLVALSANGAVIAFELKDVGVRVARMSTGLTIHDFYVPNALDGLAISSNGARVFSGEHFGTVTAFAVGTGATLWSIAAPPTSWEYLSLSADDQLLALGSPVGVVNADDGLTIPATPRQGSSAGPTVSAAGTVAFTNGDRAEVWDPVKGVRLRSLPLDFSAASGPIVPLFLPSGQLLVFVDHQGTLWGPGDQPVGAIGFGTFDNPYSRSGIAVSPDGKHLATAGGSSVDAGLILIWDVQSGQLVQTMKGHGALVRSLAFSPDGSLVASAGDDEQNPELTTGHIIKIWNVGTGHLTATLEGHRAPINQIAFSHSGYQLLSADSFALVRLWSLADGSVVKDLEPPASGETAGEVVFSPDDRLAAAASDGAISVWSIPDGTLERTLLNFGDTARDSLSWTRDGHALIGGGASIPVWCLDETLALPEN